MLPHSDSLTTLDLKSAIIRDPLIVGLDTTVAEAIAQMSGIRTTCVAAKTASGQLEELYLEARSSCVLVVDSDRVMGILTERDVVSLIAQNYDLEHLSVQSVMIRPIITLRESGFTDLVFAVNLMQKYHIRHIPVIDDRERVVGMVTNESLHQLSHPMDLLKLRIVYEAMANNVVCAGADSSLIAIAQLMVSHRVSSVMIVQAQPLQIPLGIVTERDIVQFQALRLNLETCKAETVMSTPVFAVTPNDSLWLVQQIMEQQFIRRLAVTGSQGELLGIVTQSSLLEALNPLELFNLADILEAKVAKLEAKKFTLLESRTIELEEQVAVTTIALRTKAEQEKLVAEIASQIRSSLSLETILDSAVTAVRTLLGCDRANICQFINTDISTESLIVVAESTDSLHSLMGMDVTDQCFKGDIREIYQQGRIRIVPDIYTTPMHQCHLEMLIRLHTRSKILVPLICDDRLWGLLNVCESQHPRDWQPEEVELIRMLSVHLAIAIQQATIHQKLQAQVIELQRSETRLRESEQSYVSLTTAAPVGIFRTDALRKCTYVNDRWCYIAGLTSEEAMGSGWIRALHAEDRNKVSLEWERSARDNNLFRLEYRFQRPDGTLTWVYGQSVAELDPEGQIVGYVGTITDISDRKRAEQALQQLNQSLEEKVTERTQELWQVNQLFQTVLDAFPLSIFWKDRQSVILGCNQLFAMTCGLKSPLEAIGKNVFEFSYTNDEALAYLADDRQVMESGLAKLNFEEMITLASGEQQWLQTNKVPLRDSEGNVIGVMGTFKDISDRKHSEEIIRQQAKEEKVLREITQRIRESLDLHTIFDTACKDVRQLIQADRVAIFKLDPESNFNDGEFVAESFVEWLSSVLEIKVHDHCFGEKYAPLYIQGRYAAMDDIYQLEKCHTDVLALIQVRANLVMPLLCGNQLWGLLCIHQCSGPRHWQQNEIDLTQQIANQLAIAIQQASLFEQLQQELVERHQAEVKLTESNQSLAISNQELARATRLKDEFLANMSHELRTPLNAILGMTEGLQEQVFGSINNRQLKALQTVESSSTHLLELINDILDVAKIESGQIELDYAPTAIAPLCQSSLAFNE